MTYGPADRRTDGPTDGPTDGRTDPHIEKKGEKKPLSSARAKKSKKDSKNHCLSKNDPKTKSPEVSVFGGMVRGRFGFSKYGMIVV